jgi:hypothetical protein
VHRSDLVQLMRTRRGHRPGSTGIGGFMEAVLAMMVVICGVMLVTTSLSFVGIDLRRDSGSALLQDGCRSLSDQLFSLGRRSSRPRCYRTPPFSC